MEPSRTRVKRGDARERILLAAITLIRERGFTATSIDDLCAAAGVTKGAFFHHFASKDALGVAAAAHWSQITGVLFRDAPYHQLADPLDRILAYIDFRTELIAGELADFTCLAGTMAQEMHLASQPIRDACGVSILGHAGTLEADLAEAIARHGTRMPVSAASLARHTQAVIQGGFILAKASGDAELARESVIHLRQYIQLIFRREQDDDRQ